MSKTESPLASAVQLRETAISAIVATAKRLKQIREQRLNTMVAVLKGGGLALIEDGMKLKFGAIHSSKIAVATEVTMRVWNRKNPNHEVELLTLDQALTASLVDQSIILATFEERRAFFESKVGE